MGRHKNVSFRRSLKLRNKKRDRFTTALVDVLKGFRPDLKSEIAVEVQLANFKKERPGMFLSRHVSAKRLADALAKPRPKKTKRPRVERRKKARAAAKAAARAQKEVV